MEPAERRLHPRAARGAFLLASKPTRVLRLFWFWGILYGMLFLLAHPWAHMHKDMLPWPVGVAQACGVLLDQEAHIRHHQDLESQFTILSVHADVVIDTVSQIVPPQRYDLWLFLFFSWFLLPFFVGMGCRDRLESFDANLNQGKSSQRRGVHPVREVARKVSRWRTTVSSQV